MMILLKVEILCSYLLRFKHLSIFSFVEIIFNSLTGFPIKDLEGIERTELLT